MVTTDVEGLFSRLYKFRTRAENTTASMHGRMTPFMDRHVVTELTKETNISLSCDHTATRTRNRFAYERTPSDWGKIPTLIEDMYQPFSRPSTESPYLRFNNHVSEAVTGILAMIEISNAIEALSLKQCIIVFNTTTSDLSLKMMLVLFEIITKILVVDVDVRLYLCMTASQCRTMDLERDVWKSVTVCKDVTTTTVMNKVSTMYPNAYKAIISTQYKSIGETMSMIRIPTAYKSLNVCMNEMQTTTQLLDLIEDGGMVHEPCLMSDPKTGMVRIMNPTGSVTGHKTRVRTNVKSWHGTSFLDRYNNMIRPMNLDHMCFDCRAMYEISTTIMSMYTSEDKGGTKTPLQDRSWTESFAGIITVDLYEDTD